MYEERWTINIDLMDYSLLKRFCSTDEDQPAMCNPFQRDGYTYATNGHVAIKTDIAYEGVSIEEALNMPRLFEEAHELRHCSIPISSATLNALIQTLPMRDVYQECAACDGEGRVECEYCECVNSCKQCGGFGFKVEEPVGKEFDSCAIRIGAAVFNPDYLQLLADLKTDFFCIKNTESGSNLFVSEHYEVIIMPIVGLDTLTIKEYI